MFSVSWSRLISPTACWGHPQRNRWPLLDLSLTWTRSAQLSCRAATQRTKCFHSCWVWNPQWSYCGLWTVAWAPSNTGAVLLPNSFTGILLPSRHLPVPPPWFCAHSVSHHEGRCGSKSSESVTFNHVWCYTWSGPATAGGSGDRWNLHSCKTKRLLCWGNEAWAGFKPEQSFCLK